MMHPDVNKSNIIVNRDDARGPRYKGVSLNDRNEVYLQCGIPKLLNDHETNSYVMIYTDVNKSDILVDRDDARVLRYKIVFLNDIN